MSIVGVYGSLADVSKRKCENANYDEYSFIDASNLAPDPNNTLIAGRTICYITSEGRVGKLRFPNYSIGAIDVEWITWRD
jgi:hypothetical protein